MSGAGRLTRSFCITAGAARVGDARINAGSAQGATVTEMLPTFGVILLWCVVFVAIGLTRMRRRFA